MKSQHLNIGILAHVDAGKTTLAESLLENGGMLRKRGRVDHGDAFLDTFALEKERGITIFSKMAQLSFHGRELTLVDTPGHEDFSAEMERTLQVLDCAILVISGSDGVTGHDLTLWNLLGRYQLPVFLFVNKMDQPGTDRDALLALLKKHLDQRIIPLDRQDLNALDEEWMEEAALCDEKVLDRFLEEGTLTIQTLSGMIAERTMFPVFFGSALKNTGVDALMEGICALMPGREYPDTFGARVYKIARGEKGRRETFIKVTGGTLKAKQILRGTYAAGRRETVPEENGEWEEKADRLLIVSGNTGTMVQEVPAGTICVVTGLKETYAGQGLGCESGSYHPVLEPVLSYALVLPEDCDVFQTYRKLQDLEEEIPELHLVWDENLREIQAQIMGEVQTEVLTRIIKERFGIGVTFGAGRILYKETIKNTVEGVGHFEPLRHYAEVHLLLESGERGSGLVFSSRCPEDALNLNWQRLILTHLQEKVHRGVLTGSPVTDMKITLVSGRAHPKHTEGGDFRQATYRAVREGLMEAESELLEPYFDYRLEVPAECVGRAMTDIQKMSGTVAGPEVMGERSILTGRAPVSAMRHYQTEVSAYTGGRGKLFCVNAGYFPCHNAGEVLEACGYNPEADLENTPDSVFCAHGAGMVIPWYQVKDYMHLEAVLEEKEESAGDDSMADGRTRRTLGENRGTAGTPFPPVDDQELMEIFSRTYGAGEKRTGWKKSREYFAPSSRKTVTYRGKEQENIREYLLVDGYNIMHAWDELKSIASRSLDGARDRLLEILSNYQGYRDITVIVVFDAYKVQGGQGSSFAWHNVYVVYTKEAETADSYIEKSVREIAKKHRVTVATSDAAEQMIIWGEGATRLSAAGLHKEIRDTCREQWRQYKEANPSAKTYLFENLGDDLAQFLEEVRLGRKSLKE